MSENIQPASEENKIVEDIEKEKLSENSSGVNVEQPAINLEQNRFECRSCGYIYDPSEGNKKLNIPKNTPFSDSYVSFLSPVLPFGATMRLVTRANTGTAAAIRRKPKKYS